MNDQPEILDVFRSQCESSLSEKGIFPYPLIFEDDTRFNIGMMDVHPTDVTKFALDALLLKGAKRAIWGLDRINKNPEACGVDTDSFLTVFYFDDQGWRFGVMEYEYPEMQEIDWNNEYWIEVMEGELIAFFERTLHLRDKT